MAWLANGDEAARLAFCNQSTISRRCQQVAKTFALPCRSSPGSDPGADQGADEPGSDRLLQMERQIHQLYRFQDRGRLRLHVPYWAGRLLTPRSGEPSESPWIINPPRLRQGIDEPLRLLDQRIVDAVITEAPQRPADDDPRYHRIDLFQSPLYLCIQPQADWTHAGPVDPSAEIGYLATMQPRPYLSRVSRQCCFHLFAALFPAHPRSGSPGGTQRSNPSAQEQAERPLAPLPYSATIMNAGTLQLGEHRQLRACCQALERESIESLVVRRDLASHPRVGQLVRWLKQVYIRDLADRQLVVTCV